MTSLPPIERCPSCGGWRWQLMSRGCTTCQQLLLKGGQMPLPG